jgi:uncharacterized protein YciI
VTHFLCKLLPPRPTFALDMSEAERAAMGAHVAYWTGLAERGTALIFGPVLDPAGPWGMGVIAAEDLAAVQALTAADPAIQAEIGLRYEILPMMTAVLGQPLARP